MPGPDDLYVVAEDLLDQAALALDTIPGYVPELAGAPDVRVVTIGPPIVDCCPMLAVSAQPVRTAETSPGGLEAGSRTSWLDHVTLTILAIRCIPSHTEQAPAEVNAASRQSYADAWALWNYLHEARRLGHWRTLCEEVFFESMTALDPEGGCAGWALPVRIALGGYEPVVGT